MKPLIRILVSFLIICCLCITFPIPALAQADDGQSSDVYVLTYPDGSVITTSDKEEAERLTSEWKLLYSGTTDEKGQIVLEGWADEGEILIRETDVPDGYTAETTETTADLADGEVTIINKKQPSVPATGDNSRWVLSAVFFFVSAIAICVLLIYRKSIKRTYSK